MPPTSPADNMCISYGRVDVSQPAGRQTLTHKLHLYLMHSFCSTWFIIDDRVISNYVTVRSLELNLLQVFANHFF